MGAYRRSITNLRKIYPARCFSFSPHARLRHNAAWRARKRRRRELKPRTRDTAASR